MKYPVSLILYLILFSYQAFGQASTCTQTLRLVQSAYEQGRLHELKALMDGCLHDTKDGFNDQQKVAAYKYLTLAYIYLEEPEKADSTMLKLLSSGQEGHFFKPNDAVDPAEFIALYRKFRTEPLFRLGFKVGLVYTMPAIINTYYVASHAIGNGQFNPKFNFSGVLIFEKDFPKFLKNFSIAPEVGYAGRNYEYTNTAFAVKDIDPETPAITHTSNMHHQAWLDLNPLVQYKIAESLLNPYFGVGPGISYLLSSKNEEIQTTVGENTITGSSIDTKSSYRSLAYSAILAFGVKYRFGAFYLTGDIRYQYGLNNIVDTSNRSEPEALFDYAYIPSDYRLNNLTINLGIAIPYFSPKKTIK